MRQVGEGGDCVCDMLALDQQRLVVVIQQRLVVVIQVHPFAVSTAVSCGSVGQRTWVTGAASPH